MPPTCRHEITNDYTTSGLRADFAQPVSCLTIERRWLTTAIQQSSDISTASSGTLKRTDPGVTADETNTPLPRPGVALTLQDDHSTSLKSSQRLRFRLRRCCSCCIESFFRAGNCIYRDSVPGCCERCGTTAMQPILFISLAQ